MKLALVFFTKNELKNLERIFPLVPLKIIDKVYAVDGNSTDGTQEFFKKRGIPLIHQRYPGVGGAYEAAFTHTKEDALIFFHPDGNMDPLSLYEFKRKLLKGEGFIIASRMISGAINEEDDQLFKPRKWFCQALGWIANIIWSKNQNIATDITQGYRAITRNAYKKMAIIHPDTIAPDFEQIIRALKKNIPISEFPTKEGKRLYGTTSMKSFQTGMANIKVLLRELPYIN